MITGDAVGVELPGAVERERVKPEWHPIEDGCGSLRIRLDLDQIGYLTLCGSWFGRGFQRCQTLVCIGQTPDGAVRVAQLSSDPEQVDQGAGSRAKA